MTTDRPRAAAHPARASTEADDVFEMWSTHPVEPIDPEVWAWAHEADEDREADRRPDAEPGTRPADVAAIVVVHHADDWLLRTLDAIDQLDPRPGRVIAVDTATSESSSALLVDARTAGILDEIVLAPEVTSFAAGVDRARQQLVNHHPMWLWLLHDDAEPLPDALAQLLAVAASHPAAGAIAPTLLRPARRNHPDHLLEIGQSIGLDGTRLTGVQPGEVDQRQYDSRQVLGASSAGLLVRTDAFDAAGGLRPELVHREGLDLCWRLRDAGADVVTAPLARIRHRQAGLAGDRPDSDDAGCADRLSGMRLVAMRSRRPMLAIIALVLVALLRSVGLLIGRAPRRALAELRAAAHLTRDRGLVRRLAPTAARSAEAERLRPHGRGTVRNIGVGLVAGASRAVMERRFVYRSNRDRTTLDELTGDDFAGAADSAPVGLPPALVWVGLLAAGLAAGLHLLGGDLTSTSAMPAPGAGQLWSSWWRPDAGVPGAPAPWIGLAALASSITVGHAGVLAWLILVAAPTAAAMGAHRLLRVDGSATAAQHPMITLGLSASYGLLLPWLGIVQRGEFATATLLVLAPWAGVALARWAGGRGHDAAALWAPAALALVGVAMVSVQPVLWCVVAAAALFGALRRRMPLAGLLVALAPLVHISGWAPRLLHSPARLLTGADPLAGAQAARGGPLALLGVVGEPLGMARWLVVAVGLVLWLALLVAVAGGRTRRAGSDLALAGGAVLALAIGCWLPQLPLTLDGVPVRATGAAFIALGLGALMVVAHRGLALDDEPRAASTVRPLVQVVGVLVAVAALASALGWSLGQDRPAQRRPSVLPSWVGDLQTSSRAARTLLIDLDADPVRWQLADGASPTWGSGEDTGLNGLDQVSGLAGAIASGHPPSDLSQQLAADGIAAVWVHGESTALVGLPGLQATPQDADTSVYAVAGLVSRGMLVTDAATTPLPDQVVPAGASGRLVVAELRDHRWRARIGKSSLTPNNPAGDWRAGFTVAGQSGLATWEMHPAVSAMITQVLVLVSLLVLSAPAASRTPARDARRASRVRN